MIPKTGVWYKSIIAGLLVLLFTMPFLIVALCSSLVSQWYLKLLIITISCFLWIKISEYEALAHKLGLCDMALAGDSSLVPIEHEMTN
jgi:hypothetical protein